MKAQTPEYYRLCDSRPTKRSIAQPQAGSTASKLLPSPSLPEGKRADSRPLVLPLTTATTVVSSRFGTLQPTTPPPAPHEFYEFDVDESHGYEFTPSLQRRLDQAHAVLGPYLRSQGSVSSGSTARQTPNLELTQLRSASLTSVLAEDLAADASPRRTAPRTRPSVRFAVPPTPVSASGRIDYALIPRHPSLRVSHHAREAIIETLEALRTPNPFTPVDEEESQQMADLGSGRASNGGARAAQGPVPVSQGQQTPRATLATPRDILRRREERERKQADLAAAARPPERSPTEDRPAQPSASHGRSQSMPQQPRAYGDSGYGSFGPGDTPVATSSAGVTPNLPASALNPAQASASRTDPLPSSRPRPSAQLQAQPRPVPQQASSSSAAPRIPAAQPQIPRARPGREGSSQVPQAQAGPSGSRVPGHVPSASQATVSSFPHAFERWETLSSHWEGLTSYWIHRLEQNTEELRREPMVNQLSRQVTDLSAAGANLFHAVVELQRLRASSERKFQRWFQETRRENERQQEVAAEIEKALREERAGRAADRAAYDNMLQELQSTEGNAQKLVGEMHRELRISKEEARRAWDELGRREQEARDHTTALREGNPIVIGGIQVLPTTQHTHRRETEAAARPVTRDGSSGPPPMSGIPAASFAQQPGAVPQGSPTDTDPFTEARHVPAVTNGTAVSTAEASASAGASAHAPGGQFYTQPTTLLHSTTQESVPSVPTTAGTDYEHSHGYSEEAYSEAEEEEFEYDQYGRVRVDAHGRPIVFRRGLRSDEEDFDEAEELAREAALRAKYGGAPPTVSTAVQYPAVPAPSSVRHTPAVSAPLPSQPLRPSAMPPPAPPASAAGASHPPGYSGVPPADYEGQGFDEEEWEGHNYYPTRLSDVPEQDEESRASEISGHTHPHHPRGPPTF